MSYSPIFHKRYDKNLDPPEFNATCLDSPSVGRFIGPNGPNRHLIDYYALGIGLVRSGFEVRELGPWVSI